MEKLNLKKMILGTSLLGLSFVATADHWCEFCKKEHGEVCPYARDREDMNKVPSYEWNNASWADFGEFLVSEEDIRNLIGERCIDDSAALATQDAFIGRVCRGGFGGNKLNVHTEETDPGSFNGGYDSHRAEPGLNYGLDYFIRDMRFNITNQRSADEVNTVLCLIASRYKLPWNNRNNFIEGFDLENAELPGIYGPLFESISSIEDLLKVDNAMKAESIRGGRFVWHAQGDIAAAQADQ